jgi:hypothetical protein
VTKTIIRQQALALAAAVQASEFLADWMKKPDLATIDLVEPTFDTLAEYVEALPPTVADAGTMCYLRNQLASSRQLFNAGEWGAAGHQLGQVHRKLNRTLTDES